MNTNTGQSNRAKVAEKRKPVTAAQCVFNIVLYGAYTWASARFALNSQGAGVVYLVAAVNSIGSLFWLHHLYRIRRGDKAEYIFMPVEKHESPMRIFLDRLCCTSLAVSITAMSICLLCVIGLPSFAISSTMLLVNIAAWRGAYQSWTHDRAYKKEPKVKFASEEAAERAKRLEQAKKVPVAVGANGKTTAVRHWWTDTQTREENQQRIER